MDNNYFPCGIKPNALLPAVVTQIKKDRVRFTVTSQNGQEREAWYFIHGLHLNLHKMYKRGDVINVRVISISNGDHHNLVEVRPEILPVDTYLENIPLGSTVNGTIITMHGSCVFVEVAKNVVCQAKKFYSAKIGAQVDCLLERYNPHKKLLLAKIIKN